MASILPWAIRLLECAVGLTIAKERKFAASCNDESCQRHKLAVIEASWHSKNVNKNRYMAEMSRSAVRIWPG
jgi:hypothetical protein